MNEPMNEQFYLDAESIITSGRNAAYQTISAVMIDTYWKLGKRIFDEEQNGQERADYGTFLITNLSKRLTATYGKRFSRRQLFDYRKFYLTFPELQKVQTRLHYLSWSHYRCLILHDNDHMFAAKYKLYFPDEIELKKEIEEQKEIFRLQQEKLEGDAQ